ncbi:MAG TPA: hypothetical protein VLV83_10625 [Acidobacteriota bacterium]|nr:hypothetical protein [Acidobacteriota bacterium]
MLLQPASISLDLKKVSVQKIEEGPSAGGHQIGHGLNVMTQMATKAAETGPISASRLIFSTCGQQFAMSIAGPNFLASVLLTFGPSDIRLSAQRAHIG